MKHIIVANIPVMFWCRYYRIYYWCISDWMHGQVNCTSEEINTIMEAIRLFILPATSHYDCPIVSTASTPRLFWFFVSSLLAAYRTGTGCYRYFIPKIAQWVRTIWVLQLLHLLVYSSSARVSLDLVTGPDLRGRGSWAVARGPPQLRGLHTHAHTHPFNGPFSRTIRVGRYQKGKTNLDFTEARDSEWQWHQLGICKSAPRSRQTTTLAPHHSVFYRPDALPAAQPTASKHWRH